MCELVIVSRLTLNKSLERPRKNPVPIGSWIGIIDPYSGSVLYTGQIGWAAMQISRHLSEMLRGSPPKFVIAQNFLSRCQSLRCCDCSTSANRYRFKNQVHIMSFVAVPPDSNFPIQNLPYGIFSTKNDVRSRIFFYIVLLYNNICIVQNVCL